MLRRTALSALPDSRVMSSPLYLIVPSVGFSRLTSILATVNLPQPDSPTMPEGLARGEFEVDPVNGLDRADLLLEEDPPRQRVIS